jgi:protein-tyrosine phosphatase
MNDWRQRCHRYSTRVYGPSRHTTWLSWIGDERIAIGCLPTAATMPRLVVAGVTHIVNCRSTVQTWISQDLAVERALLGAPRVAHAPMWDSGRPRPQHLWSTAARFAAQALADDPTARVLIHCQQGRRRSVMVAYAVLRLRGRSPDEAIHLISTHRTELAGLWPSDHAAPSIVTSAIEFLMRSR